MIQLQGVSVRDIIGMLAALDGYAARERASDFSGVSGLMIAEATVDAAPGKPTYWLPDRGSAERVLGALLGPGDLVMVMGAGDSDTLARGLAGVGNVDG